MPTRVLALLAGLAWAVPLGAQQAKSPAAAGVTQPPDTGRVQVLRAAGIEQLRAGRFTEAVASFEAALRVLDSLPRPRSDHGTIGIFPHYLLFMPPLNF